jgi:hypothetical protein
MRPQVARLVPRESVGDAWDEFVDDSLACWWFHRSEWLNYSLAYAPNAVDWSQAVVQAGRVVGIVPAIVSHGVVCNGGDACAGPVWNPALPVAELVAQAGLAPFFWRWGEQRGVDLDWGASARGSLRSRFPAADVVSWRTHVANLHGPPLTLAAIRKSYRSQIRKAGELYGVRVGGVELWDHYEACHRAVATRIRPAETYGYQREWTSTGHACVAVALDATGTCVAAVWALVYKGRAYYASGPSRVRGVGHLVLWKLMQYLQRERGVCRFELGWEGAPKLQHGRLLEPSKKDEAIAFYKRGFSDSAERVWGVHCAS